MEIKGGVTDLAFMFKIMAVDPVFFERMVGSATAADDGEDFSVSDNDGEDDCTVTSFTSLEDVVAVDARTIILLLLLLLRC